MRSRIFLSLVIVCGLLGLRSVAAQEPSFFSSQLIVQGNVEVQKTNNFIYGAILFLPGGTLTLLPGANVTAGLISEVNTAPSISLFDASLTVQTAAFTQGTFYLNGGSTLSLPQSSNGLPHVSFYLSGSTLPTELINGPVFVSSGTLVVSQSSFKLDSISFFSASPSLTVDAGWNKTLALDQITGNQAAATLVKTGTGQLVFLNGTQNISRLLVQSGTVWINNSFSCQQVIVNSGATLVLNGIFSSSNASVTTLGHIRGNGIINNLLLSSGAVLSPGNSIGTIKATGSSTFLSGAIYEAEVNGRGDSDFHHVGGAAIIDGAIVNIKPYQGGVFGSAKTYTILTADSGLIGHFGTVSDSFAFLDASLSYTSNDVNLTLARNSNTFSSFAATPNQFSVARSLDAAESQGQAPTLLGTLYGFSDTEARSAYTSLSGEGIADIRGAATGGANLFLGTVRDQMVFGGPRSSTPIPTLRVWATMLGGNLQLSSQGGYAGTMTQVWGGAGGIEKQFDPSLKAGLAVGGTSSNVSVSGLQTTGQVSFGHVALYGQKDFDTIYLLAAAGWSAGQSSTKRTLSLIGGLQTGSFNGQGPNGRLEVGYRFRWADVELTPYAAIQGAWINQNGMSESGVPLGSLYVKGQAVSSVPGSLGIQVKTSYALDHGWDLALRGRAAYVHDFTPSRSITAQMAGISQTFIASGIPIPANAVDLGVGIELLSKSGFSANLVGDALLGEKAIGWRGQLSLGYTW
ncbi:autotransporter domain-containing protein [Rhizobiales bacterium TNE-4]|nr:autotransporter domain-containing protein [Rhizobiales bacterium TNE-4]MBV1828791.1 autotransporter domain-containing protein [Rhizobiales bacterium TNE-4]